MRAVLFSALVAAFLCVVPGANAQSVTLSSQTGNTTLKGDILDYDGNFYRIKTEHGEVTVRARAFHCDGASCPNVEHPVSKVTFSGAPIIARRLLPQLIDAFAAAEGLRVETQRLAPTETLYRLMTEVGAVIGEITLRANSSGQGFKDMLAGRADVVLSTRPIRLEESELAESLGLGDFGRAGRVRILALDAMVAVVSPDNPVSSLSLEQLLAVMSGEISSWSELGGDDRKIVLHIPSLHSGRWEGLIDRVFPEAREEGWADETMHIEHRANASLVASVRADPGALGLVSQRSAHDVKHLILNDPCGYANRADVESIKSGTYPLTAPLFLYVPERRKFPIIRRFMSYIRSTQAQPLIRDAGFINQMPRAMSASEQKARIAELLQYHNLNAAQVSEDDNVESDVGEPKIESLFDDMSWLSTTFRFLESSTELDPVSASSLEFVTRLVAEGYFNDKHLIFAGFSDTDGDESANAELSQKRAETVRLSLEYGLLSGKVDVPVETISAGYGEILPVACNETALGKRLNRRVELFVSDAPKSGKQHATQADEPDYKKR